MLLLAALVIAPVYAGVHEDVAALMEHVRKQEVVDNTALRTAPPLEVLRELISYLNDPDREVRMAVLGQVSGVAQRNAADQVLRQQVADILITASKSDPDDSVAAYAAQILVDLPYFSRTDFSDTMREEILGLVNRQNPRQEFLLLAGVANVKAAKKRLWELANQGWKTAYLALARMGDQTALEHVIAEFNNAPVDTEQRRMLKGTRLIRDLAYTRQHAAVEVLIGYLFSDERLPDVRDESKPGIKYAQYTLDLLAQIIVEFPIESRGVGNSEGELQTARKWITAHRNDLKIKR